ncbi:MAG TPA: serine hydrolase, partial [Verrucomicrobiae bacterium]
MTSHRRIFLKQLGLSMAGLGFILSAPESLAAGQTLRRKLPRSRSEAQGVSSPGILAFLEAVGRSKHEFHSLIIVRHGHVIAEGWWRPYQPEAPQMMYSMSKSFTSTAIGFAAAERRLSVNDQVVSFFPDDLPAEVSDNLRALRVKDLLTMSVGHAQDSTGSLWAEENWVRKFLSLPIPNAPGTKFLYNSGATYMLSAIAQKVTGQKLIDYLKPRLFGPLGVEGISWETCPRGINTGGWGLKIQTEGLAKFGQLYLQRGEWNGRQLLPANWIDEATSFKIQQPAPDLERAKKESDWHQGYCYQFWRCRHNAYRGDGAFGQYTIVMPEQDAVIFITSETSNMQGVLDLVWEHLLPAMQSRAQPRNKPVEAELQKKLGALALLPPKAQPSSPVAVRISGKVFSVRKSEGCPESVSLDFSHQGC